MDEPRTNREAEMMAASMLSRAAIVGVGETSVGRVEGRTARSLENEAIELALEDAGLTKDDVDGMLTFLRWDSGWETKAPILAERLGVSPVLPMTLTFGGSSSAALFFYAGLLVASGMAEVVVVSSADTQLSKGGRRRTMRELVHGTADPQFELPYGVNNPAAYAQYASRRMHEYGTTREEMASVAVTMRRHAMRHPKAQMREPLTVEDVIASRPIVTPFNLFDCAVVSDGGWAFVITNADRARGLRQRPVFMLGAAEAHHANWISHLDTLSSTAAVDCAARALPMAGVSHEDVDVLFMADQFTICPIIEIEDLGFVPRGEAGPFIAGGGLDLSGALPTNTHGGLLSYCHPGKGQIFAHYVEAVLQLRGQADARQVPDAEVAYVHAAGGTMSAHVSMVLANEVR